MKSKNNIHTLAHQYVVNDPLHQLFDAVNAISVQGYDEQRRVIYWNKGSEVLYGYTNVEATGKKLEDLIIPSDLREAVVAGHGNWINNGIEIPAAELTLRDKNNNDVSVFSSHVMFINQYGIKQMYCIDIDLTDVKQAQEQAMFREKMLETIFEAIPDLFFVMQEDGKILDYQASSSSSSNLYALPQQFIGSSMFDLLPDDVSSKFRKNISQALSQKQMVSFQYELTMPLGVVYFEARINHVSQYQQVMVIIRDITEQHKAEELIRKQAYYDNLTSLPNRFLALDRLSHMLFEAQRNKGHVAVLFIDLDNFKKVNDSFGHELGDKLLVKSAARLQQVIRKEDTIGRLGGDEFIVLLRGINSHYNAIDIAEKLLKSFTSPFKIEGRELVLTMSIGVAMYPENGDTASDLLRNADTAMYQAKALGRNSYSFFTPQMNVVIQRRLAIEEQMQGALQRNEFELYYQPQLDVKNKHVTGAEALLRWYNPVLGNIPPDEFIPIAEHNGLIIPIGKFVIKQALQLLKKWQNKQLNKGQHHKYTMAVNLSPSQFRDTALLSFIKDTLSELDVKAKYLELEITEGVLMNAKLNINDTLQEITKLGIKLSMDDFGTGYSSLSYLRQYPFNVLKIDRMFINGITSKKEDCNLVKATIAMSHSLGLTVVAEGVETKEQLVLLGELNCDFVQGYYFSKPLPEELLLGFSPRFL